MRVGLAFASVLLAGLVACSRTTVPVAARGSTDSGPAPTSIEVAAPKTTDLDTPTYADTPTHEDTATHATRHSAKILSRAPTLVTDTAPAQGPSPAMPSGSIFVATVLQIDQSWGAPGDPTIVEWDVAGERIVAQTTLSSKAYEGVTVLRLATTKDRLYVASECLSNCPARLTVLNRQLVTLDQKVLPEGRAVSIEATEKYVAVAVAQHQLELRPLVITLFDAASLTPIGRKEIATGGGQYAGMTRTNAIELVGDRLYVAGRGLVPSKPDLSPLEGQLRGWTSVFAFDLPAFTLHTTWNSGMPAGHDVSLVARGKQLLFFAGSDLVVLTAELRPVPMAAGSLPETRDHVSVVRVGPAGQLFAGGTMEQEGEYFPRPTNRCTATWSANEPLLLCDSEGALRIARFGKPPERAAALKRPSQTR